MIMQYCNSVMSNQFHGPIHGIHMLGILLVRQPEVLKSRSHLWHFAFNDRSAAPRLLYGRRSFELPLLNRMCRYAQVNQDPRR